VNAFCNWQMTRRARVRVWTSGLAGRSG